MTTTQNTQIAPLNTVLAPAYAAAAPNLTPAVAETESDGAIDVYAVLHRALRGRYLAATWMALCGAVLGAGVGFLVVKPQYKSEGLVRFAYALPPVLRETDQNKPMAMYDSFLRTQQMRMSSRNIIELSLQNPIWKTTKFASTTGMADFVDHLAVDHPGGSEHLRVTYTDPDPAVASAAVRTVIDTFRTAYEGQDQQLLKQRLAVLEDRRKALVETLGTVGSRADQLTLMDSLLSEYVKRQANLETELKTLEIQGYMPNHRRVSEVQAMLDQTTAMIEEYSDAARKLRQSDKNYASGASASTNPYNNAGTSAGSMNANELMQSDNKSRRDMVALEGNAMQMQRLQADNENMRRELADTTQRIDALRVEAGLSGRLEVVSAGDTPLMPFKDNRRLFAAAGAIGGAGLPWLFFALMGTLRPVYRRSDDATEDLGARLPLLGTLPALTNRMSDLMLSAGAAHSVHQIRMRLQMLHDREGMRTFLITSARAGEGKTSLTTSLGLSFAASGTRTLLIDMDFVSRRLTRGFRSEQCEGAYEALAKTDARGRVREVTPGLWVMPAGNADSQHACTISGSSLRTLLDEMRDAFDIVLIDSGPVLGSVETSMAAPAVDGVVLTVSRGQEPWRIERTMQYLETLGARLAGMVFNRADAREFTRSSYWPSLAVNRADRERVQSANARGEGALKGDRVVQSVMTFLPAGLISPDSQVHQALPGSLRDELSQQPAEAASSAAASTAAAGDIPSDLSDVEPMPV